MGNHHHHHHVLKWAWVHYSMTVETFDSMDDALLDAYRASCDGAEALKCIENGDEIVNAGKALDLGQELYDSMLEPFRMSEPRPYAVQLRAPGPEDEWATIEWAATQEQAEARRDVWKDRVGADRVDVVRKG